MEQRNKNILLIITIITLIIMVFGAAYAYFVAQTGAGASANINVTANTTDSLMFEVGNDLNININQQNFGEGAGNQSDSTTAKAILMANNKTNTASYNYYLYLNIIKNEFIYTTEEQTPEILLQITKPDGTALTTLAGLNYVTVGNVSGFDITTKKRKVTIADKRLIEVLESNTTHKTEEEWQIGITFVNLDSNQQENTNKSFVSKVIIQKEELSPTLAEHIVSTYGTDASLYLHDSNLANGANDNSYRYAGGDYLILDESVFITKLQNGEFPIYYYKNDSQRENIEKLIMILEQNESERTEEENLFVDEMQTKMENGELNLFASVQDAETDAKSKGITLNNQENYVNNFVCFGTESEECPNDNLYRVIGVFGDQVKLIKYDYATKEQLGTDGDYELDETPDAEYKGSLTNVSLYYWNATTENGGTDNNNWNESRLNTVNLNTNYLNSLGINMDR